MEQEHLSLELLDEEVPQIVACDVVATGIRRVQERYEGK